MILFLNNKYCHVFLFLFCWIKSYIFTHNSLHITLKTKAKENICCKYLFRITRVNINYALFFLHLDLTNTVSKSGRFPSSLWWYRTTMPDWDSLCSTRALLCCQGFCSNFPGHSVHSVSVRVGSDCPSADTGTQTVSHCKFQSRAFLVGQSQGYIPMVV